MKRLGSMVAALLLLATAAGAGEIVSGTLMLKDAWSRATPARTGVAYLTVFNNGAEADRLVGADSPVADRVELHTSSMKDGVMRMRRLDGVELSPGEPAVFAPGGNHVMLIGLKAPLKEGQTFPLTLKFEKAGSVTIEVSVAKAGAMSPGGGHGSHHGGHQHGS